MQCIVIKLKFHQVSWQYCQSCLNKRRLLTKLSCLEATQSFSFEFFLGSKFHVPNLTTLFNENSKTSVLRRWGLSSKFLWTQYRELKDTKLIPWPPIVKTGNMAFDCPFDRNAKSTRHQTMYLEEKEEEEEEDYDCFFEDEENDCAPVACKGKKGVQWFHLWTEFLLHAPWAKRHFSFSSSIPEKILINAFLKLSR